MGVNPNSTLFKKVWKRGGGKAIYVRFLISKFSEILHTIEVEEGGGGGGSWWVKKVWKISKPFILFI